MKAVKKLVKLSSKGQITLPKAVRDDLKAKQGDLLVVYKLDDHRYAIQKRTSLEELTGEIAEEARRKGYTEKDLQKTIEEVRQKLWEELYARRFRSKR